MGRWTVTALLLPTLVAACADPTAVQSFARAAPPPASFQTLALDYPWLLVQQHRLTDYAKTATDEPPPPEVVSFCTHLPELTQMHAALIAYMNGLNEAATAGAAVKAAPADASVAATPAAAQTACPPATMPTQAAIQASNEAAPAPASTPAAAPSITSGLQGLAKAIPTLGISQNDASAAGALVTLIVDAATTYERERAIHDALQAGRDAFPAAIKIEMAVTQAVVESAQQNQSALPAEFQGITSNMGKGNANAQRMVDHTATILLLDLQSGYITNQQQTGDILAAAQAYNKALANLQTAFAKLNDSSAAGSVLTKGTWNVIQPLIKDVQTSYAALSKL